MEASERIKAATMIADPLKRHLAIAAVIAEELKKRGTETAVVGGSAVEFYTAGNYMTRDIDFVATRSDDIKEVMTSLGFKNDGGSWFLPGAAGVIVEFPSGPLDGSWDKTQPVELPEYGNIQMIGIEDIIIDRACAAKNWNDNSDTWINSMLYIQEKDIDWEYLYKKADYEQVREVIDKCREWVERNKPLLENQ